MALAVTDQILLDDADNTVVRLTCISDGSGDEVNVKKVNIATVLKNRFGKQPASFNIEQIRWAMQGFTYVQLIFDRTVSPATAYVLNNNGYDDGRGRDHGVVNMQKLAGTSDPNAAAGDGKGSILLTSAGDVAGATYDITLWLSKQQNQT